MNTTAKYANAEDTKKNGLVLGSAQLMRLDWFILQKTGMNYLIPGDILQAGKLGLLLGIWGGGGRNKTSSIIADS